MERLIRLVLALSLLTVATLARADAPSTPPAAADFGLGIAGAASGKDLPVRAGSVPEPETLLFTLVGLVAAGLLRRRKTLEG